MPLCNNGQAEQRLFKLCFSRTHINEEARLERMLIFLLGNADVNQTKYFPESPRGVASSPPLPLFRCRIHKSFLGHSLCHVCWANASAFITEKRSPCAHTSVTCSASARCVYAPSPVWVGVHTSSHNVLWSTLPVSARARARAPPAASLDIPPLVEGCVVEVWAPPPPYAHT